MPVGVGANFLCRKFAAFAPALALAVISIATTVLINANLS
jgi:hypothetical protein